MKKCECEGVGIIMERIDFEGRETVADCRLKDTVLEDFISTCRYLKYLNLVKRRVRFVAKF